VCVLCLTLVCMCLSSAESKREEPRESKATAAVSPAKEGVIRTTGGLTREEPEGGGVKPELLHSGPLLGTSPVPVLSHCDSFWKKYNQPVIPLLYRP
jgi:hypothetical protein